MFLKREGSSCIRIPNPYVGCRGGKKFQDFRTLLSKNNRQESRFIRKIKINNNLYPLVQINTNATNRFSWYQHTQTSIHENSWFVCGRFHKIGCAQQHQKTQKPFYPQDVNIAKPVPAEFSLLHSCCQQLIFRSFTQLFELQCW